MFNTFTPRTGQTQKLTNVKISRFRNAEKQTAPCKRTAKVVSFETVGFLPQIQSQLEIHTKQVETTRKVVQMMFPLNGQTGVFNLYAHS